MPRTRSDNNNMTDEPDDDDDAAQPGCDPRSRSWKHLLTRARWKQQLRRDLSDLTVKRFVKNNAPPLINVVSENDTDML